MSNDFQKSTKKHALDRKIRRTTAKRKPVSMEEFKTALQTFQAIQEQTSALQYMPGWMQAGVVKQHSLFGPDFIVTKTVTDGISSFCIEAARETPVTVIAGGYFRLKNAADEVIRLSFFDDNEFDKTEAALAQLQIPSEDGVPVLVLCPNQTGAVSTMGSIESDGTGDPAMSGLTKFWINIEAIRDEKWEAVSDGGNGADMGINDP